MLKKDVIVIGAGLAGCLLAIYLARHGISVRVFEKRPDMRRHKISAGRSINLSLSERGIYALKGIGLYPKVEKHLIAMPGRMLHWQNESLQYQPYGPNKWDVHYSVSRSALNVLLLDAAEATGRVSISFDEVCINQSFETKQSVFRNEKTGHRCLVDFDVLFGADGAGSAVRRVMAEKNLIQYIEDPLAHAYKELTIPSDSSSAHQMEKNSLHIWPRGGYMLIALPNTDGSFTATLFLPQVGPNGFETLVRRQSVLSFFETQFPDVVALMPDLTSDFFEHPIGYLGTIRCASWRVGGQALLIGDAAHAIVPFHGQGMNCAFEDCVAIDRCLQKFTDWDCLFQEVEVQRKSNADAIADMALENYIEMRDSIRDPKFHLRKKIEWLLEQRFPDRFIPRYSMVMFHRYPYAVVQRRGEVQSMILSQLSRSIERIGDVDLRYADQLIKENLSPIEMQSDE